MKAALALAVGKLELEGAGEGEHELLGHMVGVPAALGAIGDGVHIENAGDREGNVVVADDRQRATPVGAPRQIDPSYLLEQRPHEKRILVDPWRRFPAPSLD